MSKPTQSNAKPRRRRTSEQARAAILEVARQRLGEHGLDGLNVVDVARDTGISHATLIHHFGTADGMPAGFGWGLRRLQASAAG